MCSILGIINFRGLTETDLNHFKRMFLRAESRGRDASGVATQNLAFRKWSLPTSESKKTFEFNDFLRQAKGQQWIIGHARAATQGDPSQAINNHPISVQKDKFLLVHNGIVGSTKIVSPEKRTDTYIIAKAIKSCWIENDLFTSVQNSYGLFYGAAAIAVISPNEIVLARRWNPIVKGKLFQTNATVFGSTEDILKGGTSNVKDIHVMQEDKVIGYDVHGNSKQGALKVVSNPSRFDYDWEYQSRNRAGSWDDEETDDDLLESIEDSYYPTKLDRFLAATGFKKKPKERFVWKSGPGRGWWKQRLEHRRAALLGHLKRKKKKSDNYANLREMEENGWR